jgi:hypothetical protein
MRLAVITVLRLFAALSAPRSLFGVVSAPRQTYAAIEIVIPAVTAGGFLYDLTTGAILYDSVTGAAIFA